MNLAQFLDCDFVVLRTSTANASTLGNLVMNNHGGELEWLAFTLEDGPNFPKVPERTRIPAGRYRLSLTPIGGMHKRYRERFPEFHRGMITVDNVPGFTNIRWHIGNTIKDTAGCLLLTWTSVQNFSADGKGYNSKDAYVAAYQKIAPLIASKECYVRYIDIA